MCEDSRSQYLFESSDSRTTVFGIRFKYETGYKSNDQQNTDFD